MEEMEGSLKKWTLGLMSGTSMDGIDVAAIRTDGKDSIVFGPTSFMPYNTSFKEKLQSVLGTTKRTQNIDAIEHQLTQHHVNAVKSLISESKLTLEKIDAIGFHGHTILHQSPKQHPKGYTWQIGDGQMLANATGLHVVCNFRRHDVENGGEGAPLVPIFHKALCDDLESPLAIVNIGGISNLTWIDKSDLTAFDLGPGNALIDQWIQSNTSQIFDDNGNFASQGTVHNDLLDIWLGHPYFKIKPPKSLDRLDFDFCPTGLSLEDGAATLTAFTAECIISGLPKMPRNIFITGGGRHNTFLLTYLQRRLGCSVKPVDDLGWNSDFLEAQAFAYLAKRSLKNLPITFPGTTGVKEPLIGGVSYTPQN